MEFSIDGNPALVTRDDADHAIYHGWVAEDPDRPGQLLLCATNSYTFIRIPIGPPPEGFEHAPGMVPHEALQLHARQPDLPFRLAERHVMVGPDVSFRRVQLEFPDLARLAPQEAAQPLRVAIDTKLLADIAAALGNERVELIFDLQEATDGLYNSKIHVKRFTTSQGNPDAADGVLMPVRVDEPEPQPEEQPPPPEA